MPLPKIGSQAPDFTLLDQEGSPRSISETKGRWALLYFYPKDDTPGCTKEACAIRDDFPSFGKLDAEVFGISPDSVKSHKKFAEKNELPFTLLSDESHAICEAYGVWGKKTFMGRTYFGVLRTSFLIDPKGKVAKVYESVNPGDHAKEVLGDLTRLRKV